MTLTTIFCPFRSPTRLSSSLRAAATVLTESEGLRERHIRNDTQVHVRDRLTASNLGRSNSGHQLKDLNTSSDRILTRDEENFFLSEHD